MKHIETIVCKFCGSSTIVKFGHYKGVQRYFCKVCGRKFVNNDALPKMKTPKKEIADAVSMYFRGMPLDGIQGHIQQEYGDSLSESGIYNWIVRFSKEAVDRARNFKPKVGDTWIADETVLKVGGKNIWFWDIIDAKTRYLLASHLSTTRTTKDAERLMRLAYERAGKAPKRIITDQLRAYLDGIELAFGADTKHIQSRPFIAENSTNIIERFHGTLKDRTNVIRGFKNMEKARLLTEAWLIHYNFFKEHEALGNVSPAVAMKVPLPFRNWAGIIAPSPKIEYPSLKRAGIPRPKQQIPVVIFDDKGNPSLLKRGRRP